MNIPNLFIVGYPKCGTTSLFEALSRHSEICGASIKEPGLSDLSHFKEPNFQEYISLFCSKPSTKWRMEATTRYVYFSGAFEAIKSFSPDARIILGLRSPVDFISSFKFQIWKNSDFKQRVSPWSDFESGALYTLPTQLRVVKECLSVFGRDRVFVYLYDDLVENEKELLSNIQSFLELKEEIFTVNILNESRFIGNNLANFLYEIFTANILYGTRKALRNVIGDRSYIWVKKSLFYRMKRNTMDDFNPEQLSAIKEKHFDDVRGLSILLGRDLIKKWNFE